jgi:hypothetical protein
VRQRPSDDGRAIEAEVHSEQEVMRTFWMHVLLAQLFRNGTLCSLVSGLVSGNCRHAPEDTSTSAQHIS